MELLDKDITKIQALYEARFDIKLNYQSAYEKLAKLVRQVEIVYQPITKLQAEELSNKERSEENDN